MFLVVSINQDYHIVIKFKNTVRRYFIMKRALRKPIALLLTVLMLTVFAAAPAFAVELPATVTTSVSFEYLGSEIAVEDDISFNTAGFSTLFDVPSGAVHQYAGQPTVMDAVVQALTNLGVEEYSPVLWDTYSNPDGAYISSIFGEDTAETESYYSETPGQSYWKGYSWILYVNGQREDKNQDPVDPGDLIEAPLYASNLLLANLNTAEDTVDLVTSIKFSYEYVETHW